MCDSYLKNPTVPCGGPEQSAIGRRVETKCLLTDAGYRRAFHHIDVIRKRQRTFFTWPQSRLTFLLYSVTSSREFPERLPRGIPQNEFRVAQRRCIDLDDRYSPAARKRRAGMYEKGYP